MVLQPGCKPDRKSGTRDIVARLSAQIKGYPKVTRTTHRLTQCGESVLANAAALS